MLDVTVPEGCGPDVVGDNGSAVMLPRETCNGKYMISPWVGSVGNGGMVPVVLLVVNQRILPPPDS